MAEKTLLISFIGGSKKDGAYKSAKYRFEEEVIENYLFGMALFEYLTKRGEDIELLFIGTTGSKWPELIKAIPSTYKSLEVNETPEKSAHQEEKSNYSEQQVSELISKVKTIIGKEVHYILLENPPKSEDISKSIIQKVLSLGDYKKIILDITHAYRFVPYIVLLDLMLFKKLKYFELEIYYGFLEYTLEDGLKPVMHLDHLEELIKLNEALSTFENAGDFRGYFNIVAPDQEIANKAYFEVEINRPATSSLKELQQRFKIKKDYLNPLHQEVVSTYFEGLTAKHSEERRKNRAKFFYDRGQYLKAITLLYEAILVKGIKSKGLGNERDYKNREKIKEILDNTKDRDWLKFRNLRNACVHGTDPHQNDRDTQEALSSEEKFKKIFELGFKVYENLENILSKEAKNA